MLIVTDWNDPKSLISEHFTVKDATYLPTWGVYHKPSDEEKANILAMAVKMEEVRAFLNNPINISCWIRPVSVNCVNQQFSGKNYNRIIGGATNSAHIKGLACDFTVSRITCNEVRDLLKPELERFNLRMERKYNASWIHLGNDWAPGKTRYFYP